MSCALAKVVATMRYGDKLIYEARSGGVESVERYSIENDDGTITETEVREQTFGDR